MDEKAYKNKKVSKSVWGESPAGTLFSGGVTAGTKKYFENVFKKRASYEMPWLFELVPFDSFKRKEVLEIGCGAGYDAYAFCLSGANYIGIDITPENIELTSRHLSYYGFKPKVYEGDAEDLQFEDRRFDIVFSNGVLHHTPNIIKSFKEVFRVLKKEGEFWVILYNKNSIFYWIKLFLIDHIIQLGFLKRSMKERLSMIEYTTSDELPLVNVYSKRELKTMLQDTGFAIENMWIRKLVREDLPLIKLPLISTINMFFWKLVPQRMLDYFGKYFGWYLIAKAIK